MVDQRLSAFVVELKQLRAQSASQSENKVRETLDAVIRAGEGDWRPLNELLGL